MLGKHDFRTYILISTGLVLFLVVATLFDGGSGARASMWWVELYCVFGDCIFVRKEEQEEIQTGGFTYPLLHWSKGLNRQACNGRESRTGG